MEQQLSTLFSTFLDLSNIDKIQKELNNTSNVVILLLKRIEKNINLAQKYLDENNDTLNDEQKEKLHNIIKISKQQYIDIGIWIEDWHQIDVYNELNDEIMNGSSQKKKKKTEHSV